MFLEVEELNYMGEGIEIYLCINSKVKTKLVKVSNERDWKVLPTLSLEDSIYYSNNNVLTRKNKFLTTRYDLKFLWTKYALQ